MWGNDTRPKVRRFIAGLLYGKGSVFYLRGVYSKEIDLNVDECMLFFTKDSGMIAGVVIDYSILTEESFMEFSAVVNGKFGHIDFECVPLGFNQEFIKNCENLR